MAAHAFRFLASVAALGVVSSETDDNVVLLQMKASEHQEVEDGEEASMNISTLMALDDGEEALLNGSEKPEAVSSNRGIILRYMPKYNLAVCACAKCGSTSLWGWIFQSQFGHDFTKDKDSVGHPGVSVQDVDKAPWHGSFHVIQGKKGQDRVFKKAKTFAFVRDPKERLVSSWKSKAACGWDYGTDVKARTKLVADLADLAGRKGHKALSKTTMKDGGKKVKAGCMELEEFVSTLLVVHRRGLAHQLNGHFMPQNLACFARKGPKQWTQVNDIKGPQAYTQLATSLKAKSSPSVTHSSTAKVQISEKVASMLDTITKDEYAMIGNYLTSPSKVKPGAMI